MVDLNDIEFDIRTCTECGEGPRVTWRGSPDAKVLIIGQAPGREEARQGKPFVGPAGQVLNAALASVGLKEEDVLITNPVFFWPRSPDDRAPTTDETTHGRTHLDALIARLKPQLIITLGAIPTKLFVNSPWGITRLSGQVHIFPEYTVLPIIHPAAILHNPASRPTWEQSWRNLPAAMAAHSVAPTEPIKLSEEPWGPEQPFVHLHVHTEYSKLDGHQTVDELVREARRKGFRTLALTDHGTLAGWIQFYRACNDAGIKPILGVEAYVGETRNVREYMHLTILAENMEGYHTLVAIQSRAALEATSNKPIMTWDDLRDLHGVIVLTGCTSGVIGKPLQRGRRDKAEENLKHLVEIYGRDNVFLEVQGHGSWEMQRNLNAECIHLSKLYDIPLVAANDMHYVHPNGWELQDVMLAIRDNVAIDYPSRMRYDVHDLYIKDAKEMYTALTEGGLTDPEATAAMEVTIKISERCKVEVPRGRNVLPAPPVPFGFTPASFFAKIVDDGLRQRLPDKVYDPSYRQRIEYELHLYTSRGFIDYMLIVWELVNWAKDNHVTVGPGRGSVSGSLVAYCLSITDVDPIRHDIIMERFISEVRTDMPDIDLDFEDDQREKIIQHLKDKYGKDSVAKLGTEIRSKGRLVLRDVGRVLGVPKEEIDPVSATIIYRSGGDSRADYTIEDSFSQFEACKRFDKRYPKVRRYAVGLEGRIRNYGTHASGILITPWPTLSHVPMERRGQEITTAWTMEDVEYLGLLKLDILGITGLNMIRAALDLIEQRHGMRIDLSTIPLDDPMTLEAFGQRKTVGIFQFGSLGLRQLCERLYKARKGLLTFEDLTALNTLHRPAMLGMGLHREYIYRVEGVRPVIYRHPIQEQHLKGTYGIAMYQEQIMMICHDLASLTWEHVNLIRKIISKRQGNEIFNKSRDVFVTGAVKNGCSPEVAADIFTQISHAGSYAFNKAHAVSYTMLAFRQMWLKVHYPLEYHAALLICETDEGLKPEYVRSARRFGVPVLLPDVNCSDAQYSVDGDAILCGLASVDGVGIAAATDIVKRRTKGAYRDLADFYMRVDRRIVHSRTTERLITAGALKSLHPNTKALLTVWKEVAQEATKNGIANGRQRTLGGELAFVPDARDKLKLTTLDDEYTPEEEAKLIRTVLKFPSEEHPITEYAEYLKMVTPTAGLKPVHNLNIDAGEDNAVVAGIVTMHNWKIEGLEGGAFRDVAPGSDMEGHKYVHLNVEDDTDFILAHFGTQLYKRYKEILERPDGYPIICEGFVRSGISKLVVCNFTVLTEWSSRMKNAEPMTPFERRLLRHPMEPLADITLPNGVKRLWQLDALWGLGMKVKVLGLPIWVHEKPKVWYVCLQDLQLTAVSGVADGTNPPGNGDDGQSSGRSRVPFSKKILAWSDIFTQYAAELGGATPLVLDVVPLEEHGEWAISGRAGCKVQYATEVLGAVLD